MGACDFDDTGNGATAAEAFRNVTEHARYMHGHGGYTGTIAEKGEYVEYKPHSLSGDEFVEWCRRMEHDDPDWMRARAAGTPHPEDYWANRGLTADVIASSMKNVIEWDGLDPRDQREILKCNKNDGGKWGHANAVQVDDNTWRFWGWASS